MDTVQTRIEHITIHIKTRLDKEKYMSAKRRMLSLTKPYRVVDRV